METSLISTVWDTLHTPVMFIIVLGIVVFVHEYGHFWAARRNGVHCEVFSVGFGPELFGWTDKHGTRWKISALPLGGYVKMFGMDDGAVDEETGEPRRFTDAEKASAFNEKRLGQRAFVIVAGPAANFVLAIVVFAALAMFTGSPDPSSKVGDVGPGTPAEQAGLQSGDRIIAVDGAPVETFQDLTRAVRPRAGDTLVITIEREGGVFELTAAPEPYVLGEGEDARTIGRLGVTAARETAGPVGALWQGVTRTFDLTVQIFVVVGEIISGNRSATELGGPLSIAKWSGEVAHAGLGVFFTYIGLISVNLGLINLFPIPALDGGHLAMYAVEAVRGRPPGAKFQEYSLRFGLALLIMLMVFVTWNDITHHNVFGFG
ncbi:MAG: RIP metalloprotease RseP [Rhodospirillales bacterium]